MKNENDLKFVDTLYAQENATINKNAILLFFIIICFFFFSIFWAYSAKIDELARGEGKVIPSEKIQKIQSLDGGIISNVLVDEGEIVKKNQPLMNIDKTRFQASLEENKNTYIHLLITKIRLETESKIDIEKETPTLIYPSELTNAAKEFTKDDQDLFNKRVKELKSTLAILNVQEKQKIQELIESKSKGQQLRKRLIIVNEEKKTISRLVNNGSKSKIELLKIRKEHNALEGELKSLQLSIPRLEYAIDEAKNRKEEKLHIFRAEIKNELQKINTEIQKYESKLISEKDKLDKTVLLSPVNGIIKQINVNKKGGVVRSGMDLIEIVPQSEVLLVEAKIDPKDIAFINPKQQAIVKITAYDFSIYGSLEGKVVEISADSLKDKDDKDNKPYYKVVIKTTKNYLEKDGEKLPIIPGMVASIDIKTGKKSILDYILKPLLKTKENALHER